MSQNERAHAHLYDLYIVPVWRERFDALFLEHVEIPKAGDILLMECGTGGLALELADRLKDTGTVTATDRDDTHLSLARAKLLLTDLTNLDFRSSASIHEKLAPGAYDLALGDASLLPASEIQPMLRHMIGAITGEGTVALYAVMRGSFDEFFSVYWEALYECGLSETLQQELETLLHAHPTLNELKDLAAAAGLRNVAVHSVKEEFVYPSGEEFLSSPLLTEYWFDEWMRILPAPEDVGRVRNAVRDIIDRDREGYDFDISIKAALVTGSRTSEGRKKPRRNTPAD